MTAFGTVVALASFPSSQAILGEVDAGVSLSRPGAVGASTATALLAPVCALTGMALGALLRYTPTTVVAAVVVLLMLPMVVGEDRHWSAVLAHTLPLNA